MFWALRLRSTRILPILALACAILAAKPKRPPPPPPPFPTSAIQRWGYNSDSADLLCCQSRLIGWTKDGKVAILSSSYSPDEEQFRYAIDLHDPAFLDPEELFATHFFLADDSLPLGCEDSKDPLYCIWTKNVKEIGETLRMNGVISSDIRMKPPPHFEIRTIADPLSDKEAPGTSGLSVYDTAGRIVLEMPDTNFVGLHLFPIGTIVRNRPTPARFLVLRSFYRNAPNTRSRELGARLLRLNGN